MKWLLLFLFGCSSQVYQCPNTIVYPKGTTIIRYNDDNYKAALTEAVNYWNALAGYEIIKAEASSSSDLVFSYLASYQLAITHNIVSHGIIKSVSIEINTKYIYNNNPYTLPKSYEFDLTSVLTHELGHTIGIGHIKNTVMDPNIPSGFKYDMSNNIVINETVECITKNVVH